MESFYGYGGLSKSVPCSAFHYAPNTYVGTIFSRTVNGLKFKRANLLAKYQILSTENAYCAFITACSLPKGHYGATLQLVELPSKIHPSELSVQSFSEKIENEKILANTIEEYQVHDLDEGLCDEADDAPGSTKNTTDICDKEMQRRRKIGLANKGRIPWNKGRTHPEDTRARISKRTIEALSDPKVRKKMSECPRSHSNQSKAKISSALRKIWKERLQRKKLQEKCYLSWARSIAEAAKEGSHGQEELEWDTHEKMKSDIISQQLQHKADKARAREIAKLRAEKAAKVRAENAAQHAQLRKEKEEKAKIREMKALARKKSEEMKMKNALSKGLKLKARLTKYNCQRKNLGSYISVRREIAVERHLTIDNLEMDRIKMEKMRKNISLADQIQAVKKRKGEFRSGNLLTRTFTVSSEVEATDS